MLMHEMARQQQLALMQAMGPDQWRDYMQDSMLAQ
jgi:hypothetical protein